MYYAGWQLIAEYNGAGTLQRKYVYGSGIDEPFRMTASNTNYYYHADGLGSITEVTDVNGNLVEQYRYDVYGTPTMYNAGGSVIGALALGNRMLFTARDRDVDTGWYNYRYRYLNSSLGRFVQSDPIRTGGGFNWYSYPQIRESLTPEFRRLLPAGGYLSGSKKRESVTPALRNSGREIIAKLSFTHLAELIAIDDAHQRTFYETECMRGGNARSTLNRSQHDSGSQRPGSSASHRPLRQCSRRSRSGSETRERGSVEGLPKGRTETGRGRMRLRPQCELLRLSEKRTETSLPIKFSNAAQCSSISHQLSHCGFSILTRGR
jgi:RHS repeat-associated protein